MNWFPQQLPSVAIVGLYSRRADGDCGSYAVRAVKASTTCLNQGAFDSPAEGVTVR